MWSVLLLLSLIVVVKAEIRGGWQSHVSDGVTSLGYKVLYADEDFTVVNEVISREDKKLALKHKERLRDRIKPLPSEDVKCLMSVDRHCSKSMGEMKSVLIQAIKEDCAKCTNDQKEEAGKVIASMMAHDPVAWKLFLTRAVIVIRSINDSSSRSRKKRDKSRFVAVGEPEEVQPMKNGRRAFPGVKVKITRTKLKKIA